MQKRKHLEKYIYAKNISQNFDIVYTYTIMQIDVAFIKQNSFNSNAN